MKMLLNVSSGHFVSASMCWLHPSLHWRHHWHDSVSNYQPYDCLLNRLFRRRSKKISKLCVTGLCAGNSPVNDEFPTQGPATRRMCSFDDVIMVMKDAIELLKWFVSANMLMTIFESLEHTGLNFNINWVWLSDVMWRHRTWSTLVEVIAWCLTTPGFDRNQCWRIINDVFSIRLRAISQEIPKISILEMSLNITF